jgi:hypothetical protein
MSSTISNIYTLEQIFSIPIRAVVAANANAAKSAITIIRQFGFAKKMQPGDDPAGDWGELVYVSFAYTFNDQGVMRTMVVSIPLLSLIPIPLLQVKSAVFNFGIKILNREDPLYLQDRRRQGVGARAVNPIPADPPEELLQPRMMGMLVPTKLPDQVSIMQTSLIANINVQVEMAQSDLPAGLLSLLNLEQEAVHGQTALPYKLHAEAARIELSSRSPEAELLVSLRRTGSQQPAEQEKIIVFEFIKHADFETERDVLAQAPIVIRGHEVGRATTTAIRVLSTDQGHAGIQLRAASDAQPQNGLIRISAPDTPPLLLYYIYHSSPQP